MEIKFLRETYKSEARASPPGLSIRKITALTALYLPDSEIKNFPTLKNLKEKQKFSYSD